MMDPREKKKNYIYMRKRNRKEEADSPGGTQKASRNKQRIKGSF